MKCPECGHLHDACPLPAAGSNSGRMVSLMVPEEFMLILTRSLVEKSTQAGIHGYGNLANALAGFVRSLHDEVPGYMRGFSPEGWAQALMAHDMGWEIVCIPHPDKEREICVCGFAPDSEKPMVLASRRVRADGDPVAELAALEGFFARRMPKISESPSNAY